ncbi:hypothetical protein D3C81_1065950 [compost metagenome]
MAAHQQRQHLLVEAREAGQVGVLEDVGAVLVVVVVGDIQADLVHLGAPRQQLAVPVVVEVPGRGDLVEDRQRLGLDPRRLLQVDVVALHQRRQGALAHVLVTLPADHVVQHAFAQGALGVAHRVDAQGVEGRLEDRQARRQDRLAIRLDPVDGQFGQTVALEQLALEPGQPRRGDLAVALAAGRQRLADGANAAGGADRLAPAELAYRLLEAHQLQACGGVGLGVARQAQLAVAEVALAVADAAHLQALAQQRVEALADDELGAAAADVGHQALALGVRQAVRHAEVDQARLLATGDQLHLMAEQLLGAADEHRTVARLAQGVGGDDAHRALRQAMDQLGVAAQAVEAAGHRRLVEVALLVEAGGQLDLLAEAVEQADLALVDARQDHVDAVGADVDGGDQGKGFGGGVRHGRCFSRQNGVRLP